MREFLASFQDSDVARRMQRGVAFNLLSAGFNQGSTLLVSLVVANLLGRETFGQYTMIVATIAMLATLGQLSMGYTATKYVAELRTAESERASRVLGLCAAVSVCSALLAAVTLMTAAHWLAAGVLHVPALAAELQIAAVCVLFIVVNGFLTGALAGLEAYRALARIGVISGTVYVGTCTILTWHYGLRGAVAGVAISAGAQALLLAASLVREAARQGLAIRFEGIWRERDIVTRFALPASLAGLVTLPAVWIGSAILARQPGGFHQLGLFGAAQTFRTMVLFVPQAVNNVGMSILNHSRRSNGAQYRQVFWMNGALSGGVAVAVAIVLFVAADPLLGLFGSAFRDGGRVVVGILLLAAVADALAAAAYQIVVTHGRMWTSFAGIALPRDVTLVASAALLAPALGAAGLATAHGVGSALALCATLIMLSRLGLSPPPGPAQLLGTANQSTGPNDVVRAGSDR